jgi:hypothetical protein
VANLTWATHGWPAGQVLYAPAARSVGAVSFVQLVPPSVVPSRALHRPDPHWTVPSANPCWSDTNVIDSTWKVEVPPELVGWLGWGVEDGVVDGVLGPDDGRELAVPGAAAGEDEPPLLAGVPHPASARAPTASAQRPIRVNAPARMPRYTVIIFIPAAPSSEFSAVMTDLPSDQLRRRGTSAVANNNAGPTLL